MSIVWIVGIGALMYFMMIRPQQKQAKEKTAMLTALRKGDRVITSGGVYGIIRGIREDRVTLEIASEIYVQFKKDAIANLIAKDQKGSRTPALEAAIDGSGSKTDADDDIDDEGYEIEQDDD